MNLTNAVCIVTGAARGIGFSLAEALAGAGALVVLSDIDELALDRAVASLRSARAHGIRADVTCARSLAELAAEVEADVGPIAIWDTDFWKAAVPDRRVPVEDFLQPAQVAEAVVALLRRPDSVVPQELVRRAMNDRDFARQGA